MAKFVVIRFQSDADADAYVEFDRNSLTEVVGVYKAPTIFCDCVPSQTGQKRAQAFAYTRGTKYGWWVHTQCSKPSKPWGGSHQAIISQGVNLLPTKVVDDPGPLGYADGLRLRAGVVPDRNLDTSSPLATDVLMTLATITPEEAIKAIQEAHND